MSQATPPSFPLSLIAFPPTHRAFLTPSGFTHSHEIFHLKPSQLALELHCSPLVALEILKIVRNFQPQEENKKEKEKIEERNNSSTISLTPIPTFPAPIHSVPGGGSAFDFLRQKSSRRPIFTLCESLDRLLGSGVSPCEVTEFCGVPGIGKTQLAIQLSVAAAIPQIFGGCEGSAIYIATEGSFHGERAAQIAEGLIEHVRNIARKAKTADVQAIADSFTLERVLKGIQVYRVFDSTEQAALVQQLTRIIAEREKNSSLQRVKLIAIDSIAFHFRSGFKDGAERSRLLTAMAQQLLAIAERHQLAVVLINQVTTKLGNGLQNSSLVPALGETWAHCCTNRVLLHWEGHLRGAKLIKSPSRKEAQCYYAINEKGVRGIVAPSNPQTGTTGNSAIKRKADEGMATPAMKRLQETPRESFTTAHRTAAN